MKKAIFLVGLAVCVGFISSCGNSNNSAEAIASDTLAVDSSSMMATGESQDYISVPAPDEMFSFMKDIGGAGKSTAFLNDPNNYKKYSDTKSKALNFGIYAADFLYCSTFDYGVEGLKYFVNVKKLGDDLGIAGVINESMGDRIKNNFGKNDSLIELSNSVYYAAIDELEKSDKAGVLSLVIVGGWVESLHLVTNMVTKFNANDPAIGRIAEQKYTLDNLMEYLNQHNTNASVASAITQLNELKVAFAQLKEESTNGTIAEKDGKKILGGGTKITITEEQFKTISAIVEKIHDSFTVVK